ncbi:flagellar motor protein MotB [Dongia sedimenti]|uniref:Flagellar motor protein MotB n=1 Tax=Dongia sedimenti TaxID=3064282 RepID=A0ABU0YNB8_9PROT|nr:flagellar motor protein MotB [Rhodospirillaceae bacterium R-7]
MADDRPIIIKRIKKSGGAHHGGAWKVAYADFVTAMMAFFLLLWLLNAVTEEQKKGIAQYFKPTIAPQNQQSQEAILNGQPAVMMAVDGASAAQAQVDIDNAEEDAQDAPKKTSDTEAVPAGADQKAEKPVDVKEAQEVVAKAEQQQFADVKQKIEQQIQQDPGLADLKNNIDIQQTPEGLLIQLLDKEKVSMFPSGSASMNERSRQLLSLVAHVVAPLDNKLSIAGHTDATPYQGKADYSNWELSTDRANAARRALVTAGVNDRRIENVSGRADTDPKVKDNPLSPENRRISIVLLRDKPIAPAGLNTPPAPAPTPAPASAPAEPSGPPPEIVPSDPLLPESITQPQDSTH